ncbi:hypothetical protein [Streptomyces sp. SP17KL33]|uniref:hypothetical protein n=1 Tax=Streptomyces sp. SP17KL33 TaxID=3002534 RepID=UPI002E778F20|nr:hypothetical protein [Streptomyces sp. SP17KL33]MEE1838180.1 hypothetical protein [Streptomyces sp. SP17KL33]
MTQTIAASAELRVEEDRYGVKYLFAGEDYLGTITNGRTTATRWVYSPRVGHVTEDFADDQAATDALLAMFGPAPHEAGEVHRETYRGVEFVITFRPGGSRTNDDGRRERWADQYELLYGGKRVACPKGDVPTVIRKVRGIITTAVLDREMLPKLVTLIDARQNCEGLAGFDGAPKVGDVAYVYAMSRYRRGLVSKVTKTRATVSYTTASSNGRIFHKADKHDELAAGA